jgi:hypothetical protein
MTKPKWVWESLLDDFPDWFGGQLYYDFEYAKWCAEMDYKETVPSAIEKSLTWQLVTRGLYHMYIDTEPSGVLLKIRRAHDKGN